MKVSIKYNPYAIKTEILVDENKLQGNSSLNVGPLRLQEWIDKMPDFLNEEFLEDEYEIEYTGPQYDFWDIEEAFRNSELKVSFTKNFTPSIDQVEESVISILNEIKEGDIPEWMTTPINQVFETIENQEFEINVISSKGTGKSTLINALLSKELMPIGCETATVVRIKDNGTSNGTSTFSAVAYDFEGQVVHETKSLTPEDMKRWNEDKGIFQIDIEGPIAFLEDANARKRIKIVLVDTPGLSFSNDGKHLFGGKENQQMKYSPKSLALYVINSDQSNIDDETVFLKNVCLEMKKNGKQSKEHFIFVVNKLDITPDDCKLEGYIEKKLNKVKRFFESQGVKDPLIFPASLLVAQESRLGNTEKCEKFVETYRKENSYKLDNYYDYNHLPNEIQNKNTLILSSVESDHKSALEFHCGIKPIEQAISLYIDKYARPDRIFRQIKPVLDKLAETSDMDGLDISRNQIFENQIINKIENLKRIIYIADNANSFSNSLIEATMNVNHHIEEEIDKLVDSAKSDISSLIGLRIKLPKEKAIRYGREISEKCLLNITNIISIIARLLDTEQRLFFDKALNDCKEYLKDLQIEVNIPIEYNPLDLVVDELTKVEDFIIMSIVSVDSSMIKHGGTHPVSTPASSNPLRKRKENKDNPDKVTITGRINDDYVDMGALLQMLVRQSVERLDWIREESIGHMKDESDKLLRWVGLSSITIDRFLKEKKVELKTAEAERCRLELKIREKEQNFEWVKATKDKIKRIITF